MSSEITVRRLEPSDDRTSFRSGNIELDRYFSRYAGQNQFRHHIGTTYVAFDAEDAIVGFVTLSASELTTARLPIGKARGLPKYPLPVLRLARLAVDERARGHGVGGALMRAVFALAHRLASEVGCFGVVVDAKPDAVAFYERLGFEPLQTVAGALGERPEPLPMFVELGAISRESSP